ncbi:MAG: hypothetical protein OXC48_08520 [Endozoicomonadaceae bacterium]|nr:hypothetical protein [Endozoicomonadaceae bacterium]
MNQPVQVNSDNISFRILYPPAKPVEARRKSNPVTGSAHSCTLEKLVSSAKDKPSRVFLNHSCCQIPVFGFVSCSEKNA